MARRHAPTGPTARTIVAAAAKLKIGDRKFKLRTPDEWQNEAWGYYDEIGELKQAVTFVGNSMAKLRLVGGWLVDGEDPVPLDDERSEAPEGLAAQVALELSRLKSALGGQSALQRELSQNLEVAGECYLVGFSERTLDDGTVVPESWEVYSISEVSKEGTKTTVKDDPALKGRALDPELDTIIRVWQRHTRFGGLPDSQVRGVLTECRALAVLSQQVIADANSRQSAGAVTLPNELDFKRQTVPAPDGDGESDEDPFAEDLADALVSPIDDPSNPSAVVPMIIRGPAEYLQPQYLRHLTFARTNDGTLDARIDARIHRLARGVNLPVEVVEGLEATTFANASQVDEDLFDDFLQPRAVFMVDALTYGFLRPQLIEAGYVDPAVLDKVCVWFDSSALISQSDPALDAETAWDRGLISDAAYRRLKRFDEADAPTANELLTRAGLRRGIMTAELTAALLAPLADIAGVELPAAPAEIAPTAGSPAGPGAAMTLPELLTLLASAAAREGLPRRNVIEASARPKPGRSDAGARLLAIDRELRTRLIQAASDAMTKALEVAGNRLRNALPKELRSEFRRVPARALAATVGPTVVANAAKVNTEELLAGAFDELGGWFNEWAAEAQANGTSIVSRLVGGFTKAERSALGVRQAKDLTEAWGWLDEQLHTLAEAKLFNPGAAVELLGEFDPTSKVPAAIVRNALARAGGQLDLTTNGSGSAHVEVGTLGGPPSGVAAGELLMGEFKDRGGEIEGYRWVYGPAFRQRPFEPHADLDGVEFENFDDPVLAVTAAGDWIGQAFYMPGDHAGCICDFEMIMIPAPAATTTVDTEEIDAVEAKVEAGYIGQERDTMLVSLRDQGGFTIDPRTGEEVKDGFAVALPNMSSITPSADFFENADDIVDKWLVEHADVFDDPSVNVGGWWDKAHDEIVLDPSVRVADKAEAMALGVRYDQQAIYDLANGVEINTGGTGQRG